MGKQPSDGVKFVIEGERTCDGWSEAIAAGGLAQVLEHLPFAAPLDWTLLSPPAFFSWASCPLGYGSWGGAECSEGGAEEKDERFDFVQSFSSFALS